MKHEERKRLLSMPVDIDSNEISDVIIESCKGVECRFINTMTGSTSLVFDKVTRDRPFIVLRKSTEHLCKEEGMYVKIIDDKLYILRLIYNRATEHEDNLNWRWTELARCVITKSGEIICSGVMDFNNYWVDICGKQKMNDYKGRQVCTDIVYVCGAQKTMLEFYGGPVFTVETRFGCTNKAKKITFGTYNPSGFSNLITTLRENKFATPSNKIDIFHHGVQVINEARYMDKEFALTKSKLRLPDGAKKAIDEYISLWKKQCMLYLPKIETRPISIIQKDKGMCVLRSFTPVVFFGSTIEETEIEVFETGRYYFSYYFSNDTSGILDSTLIWAAANLKGTYLEYTRNFVDDWLSMYRNYVDGFFEMCENQTSTDLLRFDLELAACEREFSNLYSAKAERCVYAACCIGRDSVIEKAAKVCHEKSGQYKNAVFADIANKYYLPEGMAEDMFGPLNREEKELHKILMMPKGMFEKAVNKNISFLELWVTKNIFLKCNSLEMFLRLNNKDIDTLIEYMEYSKGKTRDLSTLIQWLMELYGAQNWSQFTVFVTHELPFDSYDEYFEYLKCLRKFEELDDGEELVNQYKWRITGDILTQEKQKLEEMLFWLTCEDYDEIQEAFEKLNDKWKQFEFSDDAFEIKWPKKPEDLIREGTYLRHCAKTYIGFVYKQQTTVLFVRKKENPNKPYFTLEIQDGIIRQCHGFDNCNMDNDYELQQFLRNFCYNKEIEFSFGRSLYGGEEEFE